MNLTHLRLYSALLLRKSNKKKKRKEQQSFYVCTFALFLTSTNDRDKVSETSELYYVSMYLISRKHFNA